MAGIEIAEMKAFTDKKNRKQFIRQFNNYPKMLYRDNPYWIPLFDIDMNKILGRKHPFFLHSEGEFFLAYKNGLPAGRIAVFENRHYCSHHGRKAAHFFFLDFPEDAEICSALTDAAGGWARNRGLDTLDGPILFGGVYGSGILTDGFDSMPPMTMMAYNFPYYGPVLEKLGFKKYLELYSARLVPETFRLPDRIQRVAELVRKRSENLNVLKFRTRKDLKRIAARIGEIYNTASSDHPETYPLTVEEFSCVTKDVVSAADPKLMKVLANGSEPVGYLMAFPDASRAMQKNRGKITPAGILRLLSEMKKEERLIINGMGILPEYQGRGGNALLYQELEDTVRNSGYRQAELVQIAETTGLMLKDLQNLGADIFKTYRIYSMKL